MYIGRKDVIYECQSKFNQDTCGCGTNNSCDGTLPYGKEQSYVAQNSCVCKIQKAMTELVLTVHNKPTTNPSI